VEEETEAPEEPEVEEEAEAPAEGGFEWMPPMTAEETFSSSEVSAEEQATFDALDIQNYLIKDPFALAYAFGITDELVSPIVATDAPTLEVDAVQTFWIHNSDTLEWQEVEARLAVVTEHAYFWIDTSRELNEPERLQMAADDFEEIYAADRAVYGSEASPGVDGDTHIYILHVAGTAICDVTPETSHQCGILGYFASTHGLPNTVEEHSNQHEMFVMNVDRGVGGKSYNSTLAHEFRHMIESNYGRNVDGWASEGTAVFAQTLIGDYEDPNLRGSLFTANTDLQLNAWTQGNSIPHYGKGYLFARYIYARLGQEAYSAWVQRPGRGFFVIDEILSEYGYDFTAMDLWMDWMAAISLIGQENIPDQFSFGDGPFRVDEPLRVSANKAPMEISGDVRQFGFDIYDLRNNAAIQIDFSGTTKVAVMQDVLPASGQYMWFSGRANETSMTLTHEFDLSGVDSATLEYSVFYRIETGWDFAHALISTDGGETWESLVGENMESEAAGDDPGNLSLTDTFYTGRTRDWENESIDLTPYVGQVVQIRFQYITDLAYTDPGIVIDNVSIPEIGYYDDVETLDEGWTADGFIRVTAYEPQRFVLLLVRFDDAGVPYVERIEVAADNTASFSVDFNEDDRRAFLIVAAANQIIMTPVEYQITISQ
jgi:hypothetical protein